MAWVQYDDARIGWLDGDTIADVTDSDPVATRIARCPDPMIALIEAWDDDRRSVEAAVAAAPKVPATSVKLRAPIVRPTKIVGAPANYVKHQQEMKSPVSIAELGMFLKAPSSVIGPGDSIVLPFADRRTDHEGEVAIVIGRRCRNVAAEDAMPYVFAYTCCLDITVRGTEDRSTRKSYDTFAPIGPSLVMPSEIGDPEFLHLRCAVNGEVRQDESTSALIYSIPRLVEYTSAVMTLEPGDVIATGTPAGVGPLVPGDTVTVTVDRVGELTVDVVAGWDQS